MNVRQSRKWMVRAALAVAAGVALTAGILGSAAGEVGPTEAHEWAASAQSNAHEWA